MGFINIAGSAGGYEGTSVANQDIIPAIKAQELTYHPNIIGLSIFNIDIKPTTECYIRINSGSPIKIPLTGYNNDSVRVSELEFTTSGVSYYMAFDY